VKTNQGDNNFKIKVKLYIFSAIFCVFRSKINFKIYSFEFIGSVLKLKIHYLISGAFLVFDSLCKGTKLSVIDRSRCEVRGKSPKDSLQVNKLLQQVHPFYHVNILYVIYIMALGR